MSETTDRDRVAEALHATDCPYYKPEGTCQSCADRADALLAPDGPIAGIVAERLSAARLGGIEHGENRLQKRVEAVIADLERRTDAVAITYQDADARNRATGFPRLLIRDLRRALEADQ